MAVQKLVTLSALCFAAGLALLPPTAARAGTEPPLPSIPTDDQPTKTAVVGGATDDTSVEDNTKAFNTPLDDARPGEYYFALGVQAVKKGDYTHAIAMYKVAASWAYKPAQYNLGVMYLSGQGTAVDMPQALAWIALAAERNDPNYVRARQLIYHQLTAEQFAKASDIWRGLLPTYGDEIALTRAKARWREVRQNATGSRVGSAAAHVEVGGAAGSPDNMRSSNYDVHDGGHSSTNPAEVAGVHQADSAVAYQQLRATDNPYDPKFAPVSGNVSVGALAPVKTKDGDAVKNSNPPAESGSSGNP